MQRATGEASSNPCPSLRSRAAALLVAAAVFLTLTPPRLGNIANAQPAGAATTAVPAGQVDLVVGVLSMGRSWSKVAVIKDLGSSGTLSESGFELAVGLKKVTKAHVGGVYRITARNVSSPRKCEKTVCWTDHLEVISATKVTGSCRETTYRQKVRLRPDPNASVAVCLTSYGIQAVLSATRGTDSSILRRVDLLVERFTAGSSVTVSSPVQVNLKPGALTPVVTVEQPGVFKSCAARITGLFDLADDGEDYLPAGSKTFRC